MAADGRRTDLSTVKRRPVSAPKTSQLATIPRILLDDQDPSSDYASTPVATNGPGVVTAGARPSSVGGGRESPDHHEYVPHRCNSDIGLPTASMPNLSLAMTLGDSGGGDKLGVYCSPRTTRRSVDLDVNSRDPAARADYEWLEDKTSSLRVLSASSRVGSAVSLNSVCTAHSVGLLSNDSDEDFLETSVHDGSFTGSLLQGERAGQLRRLQSYPEEDKTGSDPGVTPRTSHSLCNLKAAQSVDGDDRGSSRGRGQLTPEKLCLLPSDLDDSEERVLPSDGKDDKRETLEGSRPVVVSHREACEDLNKSHIVSYGKGSSSLREGRIRRWLQDMDKATE